MRESVYTLLIVESPVIAGIIQSVCPSSVYVLATGGFCWLPEYDQAKNRIKMIADRRKADIRMELREQAQWANSIIIAADSDASGDFITWSVAKFLKKPGLKRTRLHSLSKAGVHEMLDEAREFDISRLEIRLQNRFQIRHEWKHSRNVPEFELSGLISIFGYTRKYRHFVDENGNLFMSSDIIRLAPDEWITVTENDSDTFYRTEKPLSTFDLLALIAESGLTGSYHHAQEILQELFQARLPFSGESLISYPRTSAKAFYSETWYNIRRQFIQFSSQSDLKPVFMQEIAGPETPHESIHPLDLALTPQKVSGELSGILGKLYRIIYNHTLSAITLPEIIQQPFTNELLAGICFYTAESKNRVSSSLSLRPVYTTSDVGSLLYELGVCKPSGFGKDVQDWETKGWIQIENGVVLPGKHILKWFNDAESLYHKLHKLNNLAETEDLEPETVRAIISS